ncbi:MAG TPA: hypothetical protein VGE67_00220, partial [Haloferula sp.]
GTWTTLDGKRIKIFPATVGEGAAGEKGALSVVEGEVRVGCGAGFLVLGDVQPDGSRRMPARDWVKGLRSLPTFV